MVRVIIVDNDPMVAYIHRQYLEKNEQFQVVGEFADGKSALSYLKHNDVDLMILDLYLPGYDGMMLLRDLLRHEILVDVILITAAKEAKEVIEALRMGVVDYLIKPFSYERFQHSLMQYLEYQNKLEGLRTVDQDTIDYMLHTKESPAKGLKNETEQKIMQCFSEKPDHAFTVKEFAEKLEISGVTIRRYLKRLTEAGRISSDINYNTGGHPCVVYKLI